MCDEAGVWKWSLMCNTLFVTWPGGLHVLDHGILQEVHVLRSLKLTERDSHWNKLLKNISSSYNYNERCKNGNEMKVDEILLLKTVCITITPRSWMDVKKFPFTKRLLYSLKENEVLVNNHRRLSRNSVCQQTEENTWHTWCTSSWLSSPKGTHENRVRQQTMCKYENSLTLLWNDWRDQDRPQQLTLHDERHDSL